MSVLKKLAGQTAIYGLSSILGKILNFGLTPYYTNVFSKGAYGIVSRLYASAAMLNVVIAFGMETTFFRFLQDDEDPKRLYNQAFWWVATVASSIFVLGFLFRNFVANWIDYEESGIMVVFFLGILLLDGLAALPLAKLRYEEKAARFAIINLTNIGISIALILFFVQYLGKGIEYIFIANGIASAIRLGMALYKNLPGLPDFDRSLLRRMIDYGSYIMIAGFAGILTETFARGFIERLWEDGNIFRGIVFTGDELAGEYNAVFKVAILIMLFTQAYRYAVEPFFFKTAEKDDSPETFAKVFHYFMITMLVGFLLLTSFTYEVFTFPIPFTTKTLIPESYWPAFNIVPILAMSYVLYAAYINISIWFKITKQVRFALLFTGTGAVITLLGNILTIPQIGYIGSAWTALAAYFAMTVLVYLVGQKHYPIPYRLGRLFLYLLFFLMAFGINEMIGHQLNFVLFMAKVLVCLVPIAAVLWIERKKPLFA